MRTNVILPAADYRRSKASWLAARKAGLGASETAAVLGLDPWATPLDIYLDKINPAVRQETAGEAAEWGSAIEAVVARKVAHRHPKLGKLVPSPGLCQHPGYSWMLATPDRLLVDRETGAESLLEIKTTDARNKPLWADGPPDRVLVQVQQQLAVTGLEVAYVACLFGGREMPEPWEVKADQTVADLIVDLAGQFWRDHVEARVPPEARLGDDRNLAALYPGDQDLDPLVADESLEAKLADRARALAELKAAQERVDLVDIAVKEAMGDRISVVDLSGQVLATWKPQSTTRLDTKRLRADHPDLAETYSTTTTTRTFRIKETR